MSAREASDDLANWIAQAEWDMELERRSWDFDLSRQVADAEWGDVGGMSAQAWVDAVAPVLFPQTARPVHGSGLVSVPTTRKRDRRPPTVPFRVRSDAQAVQSLCEGFTIDKAARRLSMLRMHVGVSARAHLAEAPTARFEVLMVTLTYRPGVEWEAGHMADFMGHVRKWHTRNGLRARYVWVAEIQDGKRRSDGQGRGAIHYHVALWVPVGTRLPMPDKQGWWDHGSTRIEVAKGAVQYLLHYLKKGDVKNYHLMPKGARIYGVGGLGASMRRCRRWLGLPRFVQANSSVNDQWRRVPGGGWRSPAGDHYASEFERVWLGDGWGLRRVARHAHAIEPDGMFSWITDGPAFRSETAAV